jgi:hypothetical protein
MSKTPGWKLLVKNRSSGSLQHRVWKQDTDTTEGEVVSVEEPPKNHGSKDMKYQVVNYQNQSDAWNTVYDGMPDKDYYHIGWASTKEEAKEMALDFIEDHPQGFISLPASKHCDGMNGWWSTEKDYYGFNLVTQFVHEDSNKTINVNSDSGGRGRTTYSVSIPPVQAGADSFSGYSAEYNSKENALRDAQSMIRRFPGGIAPPSTGDQLNFGAGNETEESKRREEKYLKERA